MAVMGRRSDCCAARSAVPGFCSGDLSGTPENRAV